MIEIGSRILLPEKGLYIYILMVYAFREILWKCHSKQSVNVWETVLNTQILVNLECLDY